MGVVTCVTTVSFSGVIWITLITLVVEIISINALDNNSPEGTADPRCERVGQLLRDGTSACHYLVCQHGSSVWKQIHGDHSFFTRRMPCAPGTHVLDDFTDTGYSDQQSPCVGTGNDCAEKSKYPNMRYPSNKVNHGSPAFRLVAGPTGKKGAASGGGGDKRRLRQLVGLLQNIVHDETVIFSSLPKDSQHAAHVQAVDNQWAQVHRQVDGMLTALTPHTARGSGRAAGSLRTDPRTLHKFSHKMMAVILRVMRLTDKTDELMRRLDVHGGPREELLPAGGRMGGSSKSAARPGGKVGGMHQSTDVFMMKSMMDRLRQEGPGAAGKYPHPQLQAGYTDHADSGYGDYEEARTQTYSRETASRETNEVKPPVSHPHHHHHHHHQESYKGTPGQPGAKLHNLPPRTHFRSFLRSQMRKSMHPTRRAHSMTPNQARPAGTRSTSPQHNYNHLKHPGPEPPGQQGPSHGGPGRQGLAYPGPPTWEELHGEGSHEQQQAGAGSASSETRAGHPEGRSRAGHPEGRSRAGHPEGRSRAGHPEGRSRAGHPEGRSRAGHPEGRSPHPEGRPAQRPTPKHHVDNIPSLVFSERGSYQHDKQPLRTSRSKLILYDATDGE